MCKDILFRCNSNKIRNKKYVTVYEFSRFSQISV